ncbi:glycosyltransferase family 4 protein [uncultured Prevotella sp.]|uniref:glycosyltransferase family 4 protein n=1 Tax=uncultured Prevotella sp. TaxID=159272 RepID=UPI002632D290|nr:glycosyltransferase family 4 protein [uncultured Prevotella sp.]
MRVLIVNTSENTGGAAVAANRLKEALNNNGIKAKMLVRDKESDDITVAQLNKSWHQKWDFLWERFVIYMRLHFKRDNLFLIDIANAGTDITKTREFKEADVIHLSWINQGMLSLKGIRKILESNKPVVWTMHDLWPASSICHYARNCRNYEKQCGNCPLLPGNGSSNDLSARIWRKKRKILERNSILFVTCSRWLADKAKKSGLLSGQKVISIPNPIDSRAFTKENREEARLYAGLPEGKKLILFVSQRVTDKRKGMDYFITAINKMVEAHPEMKDNCGIAILGGKAEELADKLPLPSYPLGYVSEEKKIASIYNSVDLFVLPSLEDNLPNTIMEAMACGVPCVGFNTGGIPEMIDHLKNGYVAEYKSSDDLARGIHWVLSEADHQSLSNEAMKKVNQCYSQYAVAMKYIEAYNQAMALKRYKL